MSNESIINLEVNEKNSLNKIYHISGFDCANCANQVEEYLNTQEEISSAKINYSTNKMYITYKNKSWTIYELINIINKVETDNLEIYEEGKIFTRVNSRRWDKPKIISKCQDHDHDHNHDHDHEHDHSHEHEQDDDHSHEHEHDHDHSHEHKHDHSHDHDHYHAHSHEHKHDHDHSHEHKHDHKRKIGRSFTHAHTRTLTNLSRAFSKSEIKNNPRKNYHISGFDCANCANQIEIHLNNKEEISYAKIDFSANKMYITFSNEALMIDEIKSMIEEIESDPLVIYEEIQVLNTKENKKQKIMTKSMWILAGRISFGIIITAICIFILGKISLRWVRFGIYLGTFIIVSYDIFWKVILHIKTRISILDHNLLITIAGIGGFGLFLFHNINYEEYADDVYYKLGNDYTIALDEGMETILVVVLFQIGHIIESYATNKSKEEVMKAINLRVEKANLIKGEKIHVVSPESLVLGDKILIKVGELIPVDGKIIKGEALIDTSSLTGEFVPESKKIGMDAYSGCLIKQGQIILEVKKNIQIQQ